MKILKRITAGAMIFFGIFLCFSETGFAVSPKKGDFVVLGKARQDKKLVEEKINLKAAAGTCDVVLSSVNAGTAVLVLDIKSVSSKRFYIVSTIGKDGGMTGWVGEEYIYKILSGQPQE